MILTLTYYYLLKYYFLLLFGNILIIKLLNSIKNYQIIVKSNNYNLHITTLSYFKACTEKKRKRRKNKNDSKLPTITQNTLFGLLSICR